jgi:hypothetical protein
MDLLQKFKPILYLHNKELTTPMNLDEQISKSELCVGGKLKEVRKFCSPPIEVREDCKVLCPKGEIILPLEEKYDIPGRYLNYVSNIPKPCPDTINNVPFYCRVIEHDDYIDLVYIFNYCYNNCFRWMGIYLAGEHQADIENVRIRINKEGTKITNMYFSAHSGDQCRWAHYDNIEWYEYGVRPIVYVAKGSHANYPNSGTWWRIFGFANDKTEKGIKWCPDNLVNLEDRSDLVNFNGPLGNGGCYIGGTWANAAPLNQCASFSFRFFYPVSEKVVRFIKWIKTRKCFQKEYKEYEPSLN